MRSAATWQAAPSRGQAGQETLQSIFAVAFVLVPVLFSTIELGDVLHVWLGQHAAAAEGARVAGELGRDGPEVRGRIAEELSGAGIDPNAAEVSVAPAWVAWHDPITVRVTVRRHLGIPFLFERDLTLRSAYTGRGEVNH